MKTKYKIKDIDYIPRSKAQKLMIERDFEGIFDVCLFGASGVGKTVALIISSMGPQRNGSFLTDRPEYRAIFLRRESVLLQRSGLLDAALMWYKRFYPKVEFNKVEKMFTFPSGAKITFGGVEQDSDKEKYKGYTELHGVFFEELTQFSQTIFDFICSRLRTITDIPLRVRSSTNSGDREEKWVLDKYKYWITKCVEPIERDFEAKWGQVLYYWADYNGIKVGQSKPNDIHFSFCGIETFINDIKKDNDKFMSAQITDPILRAQLVEGIWGLKLGAGMYFSDKDLFETTFKPSQAIRIRYWDKACSGEQGDYLCGMLVSHYLDGKSKFIVENVLLVKTDAPKVKEIIMSTANKDGKLIFIGFEQEPGSAGKELMDIYKRDLEKIGFKVIVDTKRESKQNRAQYISPIAKEGRIGYIPSLEMTEVKRQLVNFPSKGINDDAVDALSGSIFLLLNRLPSPIKIEQKSTKEMVSLFEKLEGLRQF